MDLTTTASVNTRRGADATDDATVIGTLITEVSADAETYLARHVENTERTEVYRLPRRTQMIRLQGYPVEAVALVEAATEATMIGASTISVETYDFAGFASTGRLHFQTPDQWAERWVRVRYTGGMADDTAAFMAAFPSLSGAVEEQVVHMLARIDTPGVSETRLRDGGVEYEGAVDLLPQVRRRLDQYRRRLL